MKRRTFLKIAGMGSISLAGCTSKPENKLYALLNHPDDTVTGQAAWYASTCRECPAGCGILAKNREGRVIKIEGNPLHPINNGKLCIRGQAALQGLYHPNRIKTPLLMENNTWRPISYAKAEKIIAERAGQAASKGNNRVRMVTEVAGESLLDLFQQVLERWNSKAPLVFEPYAYESLKTANNIVFGVDGLPSYGIDKADLLVSFGADFLETWLSPVAYARKFKKMHALKENKKGMFFHVGPYRSLTGVNSDQWISCKPGTEPMVALGILRSKLAHDMVGSFSGEFYETLKRVSAPFTQDHVCRTCGISPLVYTSLLKRLEDSNSPLFLGTGAGNMGTYQLHTDIAANVLNLLFDPDLKLLDFNQRHRVEIAARRRDVLEFFKAFSHDPVDVLLINRSNPAFFMANDPDVMDALTKDDIFTVCFTDTMNETAQLADLVFPTGHFLETWDEYAGLSGMISMVQPAMGSLYKAPGIGDVFIRTGLGETEKKGAMRTRLYSELKNKGRIDDPGKWVKTVQRGGDFGIESHRKIDTKERTVTHNEMMEKLFTAMEMPKDKGRCFSLVPDIRFFDGRGADRSWLREIPDPVTKTAWQTPVLAHPDTLSMDKLKHGEVVRIISNHVHSEAPVYETDTVRTGIYVMGILQGNPGEGKQDESKYQNPVRLIPHVLQSISGGPRYDAEDVTVSPLGKMVKLAHTDGSRTQYRRKIALTMPFHEAVNGNLIKSAHDTKSNEFRSHEDKGLAMNEFPLTLPLPEGYDEKRDFYPAHEHEDYRWSMIVDLDRCIGCGACAAACYAENNVGVVGLEGVQAGREMSWIRVERYFDPDHKENLIFFPMMCQHCDNAPCESVCPVYAPHHSVEGLNNQIYNRCIGTRFCSQNCPYKVRRFNWFEWKWQDPLQLQLNPDVTVRSKGVMEKCSFCIQRIKEAHGRAKDEGRMIKDGEVIPACVQTCPTNALVFGNLKDRNSNVGKLSADKRAYQAMGYLNTKPAVIYLKKVVREI